MRRANRWPRRWRNSVRTLSQNVARSSPRDPPYARWVSKARRTLRLWRYAICCCVVAAAVAGAVSSCRNRANSSWLLKWIVILPRPLAVWLRSTFVPSDVRSSCSSDAICSLRGRGTGRELPSASTIRSWSPSSAWMRSCTPCSVARTDRPSFLIFRANSICSCSSPSGQQRAGVALRDVALLHHLLHVGRQLQQANQVGDGRAIDLHAGGQLFLRALVLIDVPLERLGLFDRVEVLALDVFDDGQLGHLAVVDFADLHRHLPPVGGLGGAEPALAGDQFVAFADAAHDQRLQDAVGANAVGQIGDLGFVERLAWLVRIARDRVAIEPDLAVFVARRCGRRPAMSMPAARRGASRSRVIPRTTQQGFQTTSQTSFSRHGQSSLNAVCVGSASAARMAGSRRLATGACMWASLPSDASNGVAAVLRAAAGAGVRVRIVDANAPLVCHRHVGQRRSYRFGRRGHSLRTHRHFPADDVTTLMLDGSVRFASNQTYNARSRAATLPHQIETAAIVRHPMSDAPTDCRPCCSDRADDESTKHRRAGRRSYSPISFARLA